MTEPLPAGAWERSDLAPGFRPEAVVLDVDGVLVDVTASFREATRATVVAVQRAAGSPVPWEPSLDDIVRLKTAGGFNDDIDSSIALAAIGLGGRAPDLAALVAALDAAGGGLAGLAAAAPELPRVGGAEVVRLFDELYWGRDGVPGLVERERPLVAPGLPGRLRGSGAAAVAVVTGRTPRELDAALALLGWDAGDLDAAVTGDAARKPDPACLDLVVAATGVGSLVYVGDVRDDWELVRRHRAERPGGAAARGVLVGGMNDVAPLRAHGVDATLAATDDLIGLLRHWAG